VAHAAVNKKTLIRKMDRTMDRIKLRRIRAWVLILILGLNSPLEALPVLEKKTIEEWNTYVELTEKRINTELSATPVLLHSNLADLKTGKIQKEPLTTHGSRGKDITDGAIHHWFGAVYIPNTNLQKVLAVVQNYSAYADYFKDVEKTKPPVKNGDEYDIYLRLTRTKLGVTAHFDTTHHVVYQNKSSTFVSSVSRSKEIREIKNAGTSKESLYPVGDDSGYIWRLNSYWRFFERDGGVVVECETIGLSRSLGWGLGFLNILSLGTVKSIAQSIAREALDSTLTDLRNGVTSGPIVKK